MRLLIGHHRHIFRLAAHDTSLRFVMTKR
jgi:hypothetical protein